MICRVTGQHSIYRHSSTMLRPDHKLAIYMEASLDSDNGKMGFGVMRYCENEIVCIVDSTHEGKTVCEVCDLPFDYPVVSSVTDAVDMGAQVLVLGTAPSGGRIPDDWHAPLEEAINQGMCLVNGLHDSLNNLLGYKLKTGQWIWDVRQPEPIDKVASARASFLKNKRVLMVGTDMATGKMSAGLEIYKWCRDNYPEFKTEFMATGQIGITITGKGIPLDAFKVDHSCGAVEVAVMTMADADIAIIEGQGSLLHPGSSATLSLMRGSCPTHLIMCHRARMTRLRGHQHIKIPPLKAFIELNEQLASVCDSLTVATTVGIALNTSDLEIDDALTAIAELEDETGLPVEDVVRFSAGKLGCLLLPHY